MSEATMDNTSFVFCTNLHKAKGLDRVCHEGICVLDMRTLRACAAHLPDVFLLGVGYTETELLLLRHMYPAVQPGNKGATR